LLKLKGNIIQDNFRKEIENLFFKLDHLLIIKFAIKKRKRSKMNDIDKDKYIYYFRIVLCVVGWISIILGLVNRGINLTGGEDVVLAFSNHFSYFTIQSNLIVLIWLTISIIYNNKENKPRILGSIPRGAVTVYITVTFLIFAIILSPGYVPQGLALYTNIVSHYILPVAFIIDWIFTETENKYEWRYAVFWLIYPILYLIYTLVRGAITNFYPYFFLDLNVLSVIELVAYVIGLILLFLILGGIYIFANRFQNKRKNA